MEEHDLISIEEKFIEKFNLHNNPRFYWYIHKCTNSATPRTYFNAPLIRLLPMIFEPFDDKGLIREIQSNQLDENKCFLDCECRQCKEEITKWINRSDFNHKNDFIRKEWEDNRSVENINLFAITDGETLAEKKKEFEKIITFLGCLNHLFCENEFEDYEMRVYILLVLKVCECLTNEYVVEEILEIIDFNKKFNENTVNLHIEILTVIENKFLSLLNDIFEDAENKISFYNSFHTFVEYLELDLYMTINEYFKLNSLEKYRNAGESMDEIPRWGLFSLLCDEIELREDTLKIRDLEKLYILNSLLRRNIFCYREINDLKDERKQIIVKDLVSIGLILVEKTHTTDWGFSDEYRQKCKVDFFQLSLVANLLVEEDFNKLHLMCKKFEYIAAGSDEIGGKTIPPNRIYLIEQTSNYVMAVATFYIGNSKMQKYFLKKYVNGKKFYEENLLGESVEEFGGSPWSYIISGELLEMNNIPYYKEYIDGQIIQTELNESFKDFISSAYYLKNYINQCLNHKKEHGLGIITRSKGQLRRKKSRLKMYNLLGIPHNIRTNNIGRRFEILSEHPNKNFQKLEKEIQYIPRSLCDSIVNIKEIKCVIKNPLLIMVTIDHLLQLSRCCISRNEYVNVKEVMSDICLEIGNLINYFKEKGIEHYCMCLVDLLQYDLEVDYYNREFMINLQKKIKQVWDSGLKFELHFPNPTAKYYNNNIENKLFNNYNKD